MTKEEAVEALLKGPWAPCTHCGGEKQHCGVCYGFDRIISGRFLEAKTVLGIPHEEVDLTFSWKLET